METNRETSEPAGARATTIRLYPETVELVDGRSGEWRSLSVSALVNVALHRLLGVKAAS